MTQYARPSSDVAAGSWTDEGPVDNDGNLYTSMDEVTSDGDQSYIQGSNGAGTAEVALSSVDDPEASDGHVWHLLFRSIGSGAGEKMDFELVQGSTVIASSINQSNRSATYADINVTLTAGEADSITNYSDLRIRIIEDTIGAGEYVRVTQCYLEVPDAPVGGEIYTGTFSLAKYLGSSFEGLLSGSASLSFARDAGISFDSLLSGTASLSLSRDAGVAFSGLASLFSSLSFPRTNNIVFNAGLTKVGSLTLARDAGISFSGYKSLEVSIDFAKFLGLDWSSQLDAVGSIGYSKQLGMLPRGLFIANPTISMQKSLGISLGGVLEIPVNLSLARFLGIEFSGVIAAGLVLASLSLGRDLGFSSLSQLDAVASIGYSKDLDMSPGGVYVGNPNISLINLKGISSSGLITAAGNLTLAKFLGISWSSEVLAAVILASLTLGKDLGLSGASQLDAVGSIGYNKALGIGEGGLLDMDAAVSLAVFLGMVLSGTVPSAYIASLFRTVVVPRDARSLLIAKDDRIYTPTADNRILLVEEED